MTTALSAERAGDLPGPDWLRDRRRRAAEVFASTPLPTTDEEVWRYSRIGDLDPSQFAPVLEPPEPGPDAVAFGVLDAAASAVVHTVDGRVRRVTVAAGAAVEVRTANEVGADDGVGAVLGDLGADAVRALHDAFTEPVVVRAPAGADAGRVVIVHEMASVDALACPRVVVEAGADSEIEVVEVFTGPDGMRSLGLPVTELHVGRDARMRHVGIQVLGDRAWQLARLATRVEQNAHLRAGTAVFGGDYARLRIDTSLVGRGAQGDITAGYFADGAQHLDFRTFQDHVAPDTVSNLVFKGAVTDHAAAVYTGLIKIRPDARGARAFQTNRNLKLSDDAWAESVPNLEIENNEVQCSHASTVGPVDAEQLFYLESRGVPTERAERLIVRGFFDEVLDALGRGPMVDLVRSRLAGELERSAP